MNDEYLVEHSNGGRWLGMFGWVAKPSAALRFRGADDAAEHLKALPALMRRDPHNIVAMPKQEDFRPDGVALTDYSPWNTPSNG